MENRLFKMVLGTWLLQLTMFFPFQTSSLKKNPRNFDESSEALAEDTPVQNVGFTKADGTEIPVKNLEKPVLIKICRPANEQPEMQEIAPNNTDPITGMSCHNFDANYEHLSVTVDLGPYDSAIPYEVYIQHGQMPNYDSFDMMFLFNNESEWYGEYFRSKLDSILIISFNKTLERDLKKYALVDAKVIY